MQEIQYEANLAGLSSTLVTMLKHRRIRTVITMASQLITPSLPDISFTYRPRRWVGYIIKASCLRPHQSFISPTKRRLRPQHDGSV